MQGFFGSRLSQERQLSTFMTTLRPYFNKLIMKEGTVKFFNETKGFGFVQESESNKEYFVHVSGLIDEIRQNDKITFELQEGKKGLNAVNVRVVN